MINPNSLFDDNGYGCMQLNSFCIKGFRPRVIDKTFNLKVRPVKI